MAQVEIKYNPYKMETDINVNGKDISNDSILYKLVKGNVCRNGLDNFLKCW